ncbi:MAG: hypothetical protein OEX22_10370 [Cyclobacteriaceae bacterium]|nr:hypothetical protein [Cyclobacteriaceae bacterium]
MHKIKHLFKLILLFGLWSCEPTIEEDLIPYKSFENIQINLTNIQYFDLTTKGYIEIAGGVKGIILYKNSNSEYTAYERNCSYLPYNSCAKVEIDGSGLFLIDPCCNSQFSFADGIPIGGPASLPLRRYRTILNGNYLTITDEPL